MIGVHLYFHMGKDNKKRIFVHTLSELLSKAQIVQDQLTSSVNKESLLIKLI